MTEIYPEIARRRLFFPSAITSSRLLLARLPATAGIVTEVPKGRLFGGSLGWQVCSNHSALSS